MGNEGGRGKTSLAGGRCRVRVWSERRDGEGDGVYIGERTMMVVFQSATFSCSYLSAEARAVSTVCFPCQHVANFGTKRACVRSGRSAGARLWGGETGFESASFFPRSSSPNIQP